MALLLHRERSRETTATDQSGSDPEPDRPPSRRVWWLPRLLTIGLWTLVVGGVVLGGMALVRPVPAQQLASAPTVDTQRWDAAGFAELYVASFVAAGEGSEATLAPFLGEVPPSLDGVTAGQWFASRTTTTALERVTESRWAVIVAADLLRRDGDPRAAAFVTVGVRFFRVEVVDDGAALVAAALPAIVAGPVEGGPVDDDWPTGSPPRADDPLADTVERFAAALLTGNGELGRYAAPGSDLRAAGATFETVTLERLAARGEGEQRRVRAWLTGVSGTASMQLVYDLHLTRRDGRWEVDAVGTPAAPSPAVPAATADPSSTSSGS